MQQSLFSTIAEATNPQTVKAILGAVTQQAHQEQPAPAPDPYEYYNTLDDVLKDCKKVGTTAMSYGQYLAMREKIRRCETNIKMLLNKYKVAQLKTMVYSTSGDNKEYLIGKAYDGIIAYFLLNKMVSYSPFDGETYEGAKDKTFKSICEADYTAYTQEQEAKRAAYKKAIENPETKAEFQTLIRAKGVAALTSEQKAIFDDLCADASRDRRAQEEAYKKDTVKAVEVAPGLEMEIKKSRHTKKNIDLWVVVLSSKVERETYTELNSRAKKLGGYYSSFRGGGAIPGFTFESEENALLFTQVKDGDVNAAAIREKSEAERQQDRAETLETKAANIEESATDSLNRDRKDNTHKRAAEAASAERQALAALEFSQTMQQIADRMKAGTIKYLDRLQNITELETLLQIVAQAKRRYIIEKKINTNNEDPALIPEMAEYAKYPLPDFWVSNGTSDILKIRNEPGKKLAAARMLKRLAATKDKDSIYICEGRQAIEDYQTLFCDFSRILDKYTRSRYNEDMTRYKRMQRLQLLTMSEFRAAIRELINIMSGVEVSPEQKKMQQLRDLERQFIGRNIPGFFPTPAMLSATVVDWANIQEGDKICEPSAGLGHLAEVIRTQHPANDLTCIEYNSSLAAALVTKEFTAIHNDFLEHSGSYDKIIMNPPFENGQDMDHVTHAWSLLNNGGRIVAIMADNKTKGDSKTLNFMRFLSDNGAAIEKNPAGAFLSSFRPTGVNTITVILNK